MSILRPIGHIAARLDVLAISVVYRLRLASDGAQYDCWVQDDGCVYLAPSSHRCARAMLRHAPEQRVSLYAKPRGAPFPLTAADIIDDLTEARLAHARRQLQQATEAAAA